VIAEKFVAFYRRSQDPVVVAGWATGITVLYSKP